MSDADITPTAPIPALPYHRPTDAKSLPWYAVVLAVGWGEIVLGGVHIVMVFNVLALGRYRNSFATMTSLQNWPLILLEIVLYGVLLVGGWKCLRLDGRAWKLSTYTLGTLAVLKILMTVLTFIHVVRIVGANSGTLQGVVLASHGVLMAAKDLVPIATMFWLLRLSGVREMFGVVIKPSRP